MVLLISAAIAGLSSLLPSLIGAAAPALATAVPAILPTVAGAVAPTVAPIIASTVAPIAAETLATAAVPLAAEALSSAVPAALPVASELATQGAILPVSELASQAGPQIAQAAPQLAPEIAKAGIEPAAPAFGDVAGSVVEPQTFMGAHEFPGGASTVPQDFSSALLDPVAEAAANDPSSITQAFESFKKGSQTAFDFLKQHEKSISAFGSGVQAASGGDESGSGTPGSRPPLNVASLGGKSPIAQPPMDLVAQILARSIDPRLRFANQGIAGALGPSNAG